MDLDISSGHCCYVTKLIIYIFLCFSGSIVVLISEVIMNKVCQFANLSYM